MGTTAFLHSFLSASAADTHPGVSPCGIYYKYLWPTERFSFAQRVPRPRLDVTCLFLLPITIFPTSGRLSTAISRPTNRHHSLQDRALITHLENSSPKVLLYLPMPSLWQPYPVASLTRSLTRSLTKSLTTSLTRSLALSRQLHPSQDIFHIIFPFPNQIPRQPSRPGNSATTLLDSHHPTIPLSSVALNLRLIPPENLHLIWTSSGHRSIFPSTFLAPLTFRF